jgi:hypothetical protein
MKKTKGFILVETLIVSVTILTTLVYIFTQFQKIESNYSLSFKYNTTDNLYKVANFRSYLLEGLNDPTSNYDRVLTQFLAGSDYAIDLTSCPSTLILLNQQYCTSLINKLDIKQVIFTREDLTDLVVELKNLYFVSEEMKDFIKYINHDSEAAKYRLIVEFNNGTFASLKIYEGI